jgi:hypothetical protein
MKFKRIALVIIGLLFFGLSMNSALAYTVYYDDDYRDYNSAQYGYPIYTSGYYSNTWNYGWSGWDYNRVYYRYHYPYSTYRYNSYYPPGTWVAHYNYRVYPMAVAYPFPGYYW